MSRVRVPQEALGARPVSLPGFSVPQFQPTVAGQLAGVLSGAVDATTQAVGFMSAVESMKAREAIIDVRNNRAAIAEAEQNARQLQIEEERAAALMRGQAGRDVDAIAGDIIAAFESGQMDAHIGRVVDNDVLNQIADGYAEPATAGWGADSEYTRTFKAEVRKLVTDRGIRRQAGLQEADRQQNIANLQRDFSTASSVDEIRAGIEANKGFVGLNDQQFIEQIVTPVLQGRAMNGDATAAKMASELIPDSRVVESIQRHLDAFNESRTADAHINALNTFSLRSQRASSAGDVSGLSSLQRDIQEFQSKPENAPIYAALNSMWESADNEIRQIEKQQLVEKAQVSHNDRVSQAVAMIRGGDGYAVDTIETQVPGTSQSITTNKSELNRIAFDLVKRDAESLYPDDPTGRISHQIDYVSQSKNFPNEWTQVLQVGASAADSLLLDSVDGKETPIPAQTAAGFELYKAISARAPYLLASMVSYDDRKFYERTMSEMRRGVVGNDVRKAMLSAKVSIQTRPSRVDISGPTILSTLSEIQVSPTNGTWGGANPMFTSIENELIARADLFADLTPAEAAKKAAEEIKPNLVRINGFTTYMVNPPSDSSGESFSNVISDRLESIARDKGVELRNLYVTEDLRTGMLRVSDRSTLTPVDSIDPRDLAAPVQADKAKSAVAGQNFRELTKTNPGLMGVYWDYRRQGMTEKQAMSKVVSAYGRGGETQTKQSASTSSEFGISVTNDASAIDGFRNQ